MWVDGKVSNLIYIPFDIYRSNELIFSVMLVILTSPNCGVPFLREVFGTLKKQ